jgi:sulfonate transport system ATP-binding protein
MTAFFLPKNFDVENDDTVAPPRGIGLALRDVRKTYGTNAVLKGIDLSVDPGAFVAVVGRSGCGKSSLLRLLDGTEAPSSGQVAFERTTAERIAFQDARLRPWARVGANVAVGLGRRRRAPGARGEVMEALAAVGLAGRERAWPLELSGGQRHRVALARALVGNPGLLALDEPFRALDALARAELLEILEQAWLDRGFTAVLATHDVSVALTLADRVVVIEDGRVALDLAVEVPRPRRRGSAALAELEDRILRSLLGQHGRSQPEYSIEPPANTSRQASNAGRRRHGGSLGPGFAAGRP